MRSIRRSALTAVAMIALTGPLQGQSPDISGEYGLKGVRDGNGLYAGTAAIHKIGGSMYAATYTFGSATAATVYTGVCFRDQDALSCASCPIKPLQPNPTLAAYLTSAQGLNGVFFSRGDILVGKEVATPQGMTEATKESPGSKGRWNPVTLAGTFVLKGTYSDKAPYTGSATVRQVVEVSPTAYTVDWDIPAAGSHPSAVIHGVGVRSVARSLLATATCGFKSGYSDVTALIYTIDPKGKTLAGAWAGFYSGAVKTGSETLTRY